MFHVNPLPSRSYFLCKSMKKYLWMSSDAVVIGALRVKWGKSQILTLVSGVVTMQERMWANCVSYCNFFLLSARSELLMVFNSTLSPFWLLEQVWRPSLQHCKNSVLNIFLNSKISLNLSTKMWENWQVWNTYVSSMFTNDNRSLKILDNNG